MPIIAISKFNETHIRVDSDDRSVLYELSDHFTFIIPNAQFNPKVKAHAWDGRVRLYSLKTHLIYLGLHSKVKEFAEKNGYECIYMDPLDSEKEFSVVEAQAMFKALKLSSQGSPIEVRDYQERGIIHAIQSKRCILLSSTSSGKSLSLYILVRYYLATTKNKILIIVPNVSLVKQLFGDFKDYATNSNWNADKHCHQIFAGQEKDSNKRVSVTTWQSVSKLPPTYFEDFDVVMNDEVHGSSSKEVTSIMEKVVNAKYRIGVTGTLRDCKTNAMVLEGLFGPPYNVVSTRELMDKGTVADLTINCIQLQYPTAIRKAQKKAIYADEMDFLVGYLPRNNFIRNLALSLKGNTLVLFQLVEKHGKPLHEMIASKAEDGRKVFFVHGKTDADDRDEIRGITEGETNAIIVASYGTFSTGINIRNIDNVIFASPTKSKIRVLQSLGRVLRTSSRKTTARLYDICDDLSWTTKSGNVSWQNYSLRHFIERINYYNAEKLKYKMYKVQLEASAEL